MKNLDVEIVTTGTGYKIRRVQFLLRKKKLKQVFCCYCCCCSVAKSWLTLRDPTNGSTAGFPVLHYLLEFAQIHVLRISAITCLFHPLPPPSSFALNLSQHMWE